MVAVLGMTSLFITQMNTDTPFANYHVSDFSNIGIETSNSESSIYEISKLVELKSAYQKLNSSEKM
jgi:hypothetical protein